MTKTNNLTISAVFMTAIFVYFTQSLLFETKKTQAYPDLPSNQCGFSQQIKTNFPEMTHSFAMAEYPIEHQGNNYLNISVIFTEQNLDLIKESNKMNEIHLQINDFLLNYPNESDYWEVLNQNLVKDIFASHPQMSSMTIKLEVLPNEKSPNSRTTTVTVTNKTQLFGKWNFAINNHPIKHKGENILDIDVEYTYYYEGASNSEYIDFLKIRSRITQLLSQYPNTTDSWEEINQNIAKIIFNENPALSSLNLTLKILPNQQYPYLRANSTMLNRCLVPSLEDQPLTSLHTKKN